MQTANMINKDVCFDYDIMIVERLRERAHARLKSYLGSRLTPEIISDVAEALNDEVRQWYRTAIVVTDNESTKDTIKMKVTSNLHIMICERCGNLLNERSQCVSCTERIAGDPNKSVEFGPDSTSASLLE